MYLHDPSATAIILKVLRDICDRFPLTLLTEKQEICCAWHSKGIRPGIVYTLQ